MTKSLMERTMLTAAAIEITPINVADAGTVVACSTSMDELIIVIDRPAPLFTYAGVCMSKFTMLGPMVIGEKVTKVIRVPLTIDDVTATFATYTEECETLSKSPITEVNVMRAPPLFITK